MIFAFYSFCGWIIEAAYRSFGKKKFVNPGFLHGPFVIIYGFGVLLLLGTAAALNGFHPLIHVIAGGILLTALEFAAGMISEKVFGITLWDYSDLKYNYKGKISVGFSIAWLVLAAIIILAVHPLADSILKKIDLFVVTFSAGFLFAYFLCDLALSIYSMKSFLRKVSAAYEQYLSISAHEINLIFDKFKRISHAFPALNRLLNENFRDGLKLRAQTIAFRMNNRLLSIIKDIKEMDREFLDIVGDILDNSEFQKLKNFQHHDSSIFEHAQRVSFVSYKIARYLKLDHISAARGGLLHDFFLYNWRNHDYQELPKHKFHGPEHPKIAIRNAEKNFRLTPIEKDIIVKHMWPLTFVPPRYKESYLVSFVDKYIASKEFMNKLKNIKKKPRKK
jgi:uncharacterized protein